MKHEPVCATNIRCAVYHENGVCPDQKNCNCKVSGAKEPAPKEEELVPFNPNDAEHLAGFKRTMKRIGDQIRAQAEPSYHHRFRERFINGAWKLLPIGGKFIGGAEYHDATEEFLAFMDEVVAEETNKVKAEAAQIIISVATTKSLTQEETECCEPMPCKVISRQPQRVCWNCGQRWNDGAPTPLCHKPRTEV